MHLLDGVISSTPMLAGGYAITGLLCAWSAYKIKDQEIPKVALVTAAFFTSSLIHFPLGPASVHLILNGLIGVLLGRRAFLVFPIGLFLQVTIGEGGISVLGLNACILGLPAIVSWKLYEWISQSGSHMRFFSALLGAGTGVLGAGLLFMLVLLSAGEEFIMLARFALLAHIPILILESVVTGFTVEFLARVQPAMVKGGCA